MKLVCESVIENSFSVTSTLVPTAVAEEGEGDVAVGLDAAEGVAVFVLVPQAPSRRATKAAVTKRAPAV